MLDRKDEVLTTMAGSFGYAAPEVMLKQGHGKPVDMWSMGVITYTLLCGYSPFRSETLHDLIEECTNNKVLFHERYWKDVSNDAKDFILGLLQADADKRKTSAVCGSELPPPPYLPPLPSFRGHPCYSITAANRAKKTYSKPSATHG
jgi:serine/threonine protein kinase